MGGEIEIFHHRRRAKRQVIAVADVHGCAGERLARSGAADGGPRLDEHRSHPGLGQVRGRHQTVVSGADNDRINISLSHSAILAAALA